MSDDASGLCDVWDRYRMARIELLSALGLPQSCRDPLAEFAEILVARLLDGKLATNRVQKGWDVDTPIGFVQVRYVTSRPDGSWNWHIVKDSDAHDWYALVVYTELCPVAVYLFPKGDLTRFCQALGKQHCDQATTLQFTKKNHLAIAAQPDKFRELGMQVFLLEHLQRE